MSAWCVCTMENTAYIDKKIKEIEIMNRQKMMKTLLTVCLFFPAVAFAHTEDDGMGFVTGLLHPIFGYDHLLAMLSVGIVSAQLGGRSIWTIPVLFVASMVFGGVLGANQILFPFVEIGIALSVVILGLTIIYAHKQRFLTLIMLIVAFFGILHGHAHGVEMPGSASPVFYSFGFVVSTSTIHLLGVLCGLMLNRREKVRLASTYLGGVVTAMGFFILYGLTGAA